MKDESMGSDNKDDPIAVGNSTQESISGTDAKETHAETPIPDCNICNDIWELVKAPYNARRAPQIDLGPYREALNAKCPTHMPLLKLTDYYLRYAEAQGYRNGDPVGVTIRVDEPGCLTVVHRLDSLDFFWPNYRFYWLKMRKEGHHGIARVLDENWFDTRVVDFWLNKCRMNHDTCGNPMAVSQIRPAWLVDTVRKCLIRGQSCESFVALSYRWGENARRLQFKEDTMPRLQIPNSLEEPDIASQIAPLVHHAIQLSARVRQRHIWIDALCIDHSHPQESRRELERMGAIYANAAFTIVVMDTDAEQGIPGLREISPPRKHKRHLVAFGDEALTHEPPHCTKFDHSVYQHRAWTHQEYHLSRRKLIIREESLHCICQSSQWDENLISEVKGYGGFRLYDDLYSSLSPVIRGIPNLITLQILITRYNKRDLTYAEDALPGIIGLLTLISRGLEGGFLCGIPEMFFESALMWHPRGNSPDPDLKRRVFSDRPEKSRLQPCLLPSWSWVGWEGTVWIDRGEIIDAERDARAFVCETHPVTVWYSCDSPAARNRRKIKSTWIENRSIYTNPDEIMPEGWSREEVPESHKSTNGFEEFLLERGYDKWYYRHSKMPKVYWYWPFPVRNVDESSPTDMPDQWPYLCCNTMRARVHAFRPSQLESKINHWIRLYNSNGHSIGGLEVHNIEELEDYPAIEAGWHESKEVELVAVCRKVCGVPPPGRPSPRRSDRYESHEIYGVLSIEWIDGVAYRLASGEVERAAWEALELEDIFLVLG